MPPVLQQGRQRSALSVLSCGLLGTGRQQQCHSLHSKHDFTTTPSHCPALPCSQLGLLE